MSPEQAAQKPVDARSDLYALGIMLFEGATGRRPFRGDSVFELLRQHVEEAPPMPHTLRADLPAAYEAVIVRALAKQPEDRFASAVEMSRALADALAAPRTDPSAPRGSRGRRLSYIAAATLAFAGMLGGLAYVVRDRGSQRTPPDATAVATTQLAATAADAGAPASLPIDATDTRAAGHDVEKRRVATHDAARAAMTTMPVGTAGDEELVLASSRAPTAGDANKLANKLLGGDAQLVIFTLSFTADGQLRPNDTNWMFRRLATNTCEVIIWLDVPGAENRLKRYQRLSDCQQPIPHAPRCSTDAVHRRALAKGLPANRPYGMRYVDVAGVFWFVYETGANQVIKIDDDC
jgi:hypothetical protein